jgi:hypothetical protein
MLQITVERIFSCCVVLFMRLVFISVLSFLHRTHVVLVFEILFADLQKQTQMAMLSKERDSLSLTVRTYKSLFETTEQLIAELRSKQVILDSHPSICGFKPHKRNFICVTKIFIMNC